MIKYIKLSVTLLVFLSALFLSGFGVAITTAKAIDLEAADGPTAPLAVCTASTPGMVAYWPLDDPQIAPPMTFDDLLNNPPEHPGHPGTCSSAGSCPTSTSGIVGDAYSFDGNDQITAPDGDDLDFAGDGSFSIEMWVKTSQICHVENLPPDPGTPAPKVFTSKWSNGASWWVGCNLYWDAINLVNIDVATFSLRSSAGGDGDVVNGVTAINDNAWHHVVAVREGATGSATENQNRLYVDGVEVASLTKTYTGTFANENLVKLGFHIDSYFYSGILDEVAIYSQALAPGDITAHYNAGAGTTYCDEPLRVTNPGNQVHNENVTITPLPIAHTPSGTTITSYGATGLPPGLSINTGSGVISGTLDYTANAGSPYTVTVTANSASGSDTTVFTWTVNNVNRAPEITSVLVDQSHTEGEAITPIQVTATDLDGDLVTFTAPNLPPGVTITSGGLISGTIDFNAYEDGSPYTVVVTATDNVTPTPGIDTGQFTWTITNANFAPEVDNPGNRTNNAGDIVALQIVATDEDVDDELAYTATGLPVDLNLGLSSGLISGVLTANSIGVHDVAVTVSDGHAGNEVTVEFTWTVTSNAPIVINPGNKTNKERDSVSLQIMATDEDDDDLIYTANGLPQGLSINASSGLISGILSISSAGSHTVLVTVSDGVEGNERTVQFVWTVTNVEFNFMPLIIQVTP